MNIVGLSGPPAGHAYGHFHIPARNHGSYIIALQHVQYKPREQRTWEYKSLYGLLTAYLLSYPGYYWKSHWNSVKKLSQWR